MIFPTRWGSFLKRSPGDDPALILVTGAAGKLGRRVVEQLHQAGYRVRACDLKSSTDLPVAEWKTLNLADHRATARVLRGVSRVAHLGNHPSNSETIAPEVVFNQNVASNCNVFQAAATEKVKRVVFASSIQAMFSEGSDSLPSSLPLNGSETASPGNTYGLSKQVGETTLAFYCRNSGLSGCSLRFPQLAIDLSHLQSVTRPLTPTHVAHALAWLSLEDAARLVVAAICTDLPGHRTYLPASPCPRNGVSVNQAITSHYREVPWSEGAPRTALVDGTALQEDFGWSPQDRWLEHLHLLDNFQEECSRP